MAKEVKKGYNFAESEKKWSNFWEKNKTYRYNPENKNTYSIDTPPPTVSGEMHMGHAFGYSQQDFIARYRRMKQGVYYPFGTDDNGLPTERLVEKLKKVKSSEMTREEFIELCLATIKEIRSDFIQSWKDIGVSSDYDMCYSTIDDKTRKISQKSFLDLLKKEEIYKEEFPTIWCPECQTSIAQAELEDKEQRTKFSTLKFKIKEINKDLLIATTRPELLKACVAVFVHPEDERFKDTIGKTAITPLFEDEVPIIADKSADPKKGTGVLMICSYGDKFDVEAINRHKLEPKIVFTKDGKANYSKYNGLPIKETRKKILEDLQKNGLIIEQKEIENVVNTHDKCGTEIEFFPTKQWFIKILDKKDQLIKQGEKINWQPEYMFKRYKNWVENLEWDWNISRNRHFGIPIPVWECEKCQKIILAEESELPIDPTEIEKECPNCKTKAKPETMVLDTWATSSISPQIISELTNNKVTIPQSLRPQGHDIIRTWAFYTIVRSYLEYKEIPWKNIMISGNVSLKGEKLSKSKGITVDPKEVLKNYGADALRFWAAGSNLGSDLDYQEQDLIAGKKMITKIYNASKFVFMNLQNYKKEKPETLETTDSLFLKKLDKTIETITDSFENYEYSKAKQEIESFFWKDFCDNYLEIVKKRVYNESGNAKLSAQYSLYHTLLSILKMIAPIMPFITEEIYQTYYKENEKVDSIHLTDWPTHEKIKQEDFKAYDELCNIITKVRQEKTKAQKSMAAPIKLTLKKEKLTSMLSDLKNVSAAVEISDGSFKVEFL